MSLAFVPFPIIDLFPTPSKGFCENTKITALRISVTHLCSRRQVPLGTTVTKMNSSINQNRLIEELVPHLCKVVYVTRLSPVQR